MQPLLGFGHPMLAAADPFPHYGLRRDEACVVVDYRLGKEGQLVIVNGNGAVFLVAAADVVIANPAGPGWSPEWIREMTARRAAP